MIGDGRKAIARRVMSDLMTPGRVTKKLKAQSLEFLDDLSIFEP
jgi:hypothetical protein